MLPEALDGDAAAQLQRSLLAAIVESTGDAVISLDRDGVITSWNAAAQQLYGHNAARAVGSHISMLFPHPDELDGILQRVFAGEQVAEARAARIHQDGRPVTVGETLSPVRSAGEVVGAAIIARDIGARMQVEQALAETRRELEAKNRSLERSNAELEQFAYVASHDLSEPLRAVAGMVSLLARRYSGQLDSDADEFIAFAVEGCERMRLMIEDLLDFSRAGRMELHPEDVDLAQIVERAVAALRSQIEETAATVELGELPVVYADPAQLARVLQNLVTNAIKFRRPEQPPQVQVRAQRTESGWRITVADNGIGIEPQYRPRVFGMFERLHTRDVYPGTGMGLAIAERIVDRHGGTIGVDETPGGGATFWFTLPDAQSEELSA